MEDPRIAASPASPASPAAPDAPSAPPPPPEPPAVVLAFPVTAAMKTVAQAKTPHAPIVLGHTAESTVVPIVLAGDVPTPLEEFFEDLQHAKRTFLAQLGVIEVLITRIGAMHVVLPDELVAMQTELNDHLSIVVKNADAEHQARVKARADARGKAEAKAKAEGKLPATPPAAPVVHDESEPAPMPPM
jgi:hypothetical protein